MWSLINCNYHIIITGNGEDNNVHNFMCHNDNYISNILHHGIQCFSHLTLKACLGDFVKIN